MAEVPIQGMPPGTVPVVTETAWVGPVRRIRWSAIWAGLVVAVALQTVLTALGLAIGIGSLSATTSSSSFGVGTAIWLIVTSIISLWVGGFTAGRLAEPATSGALHGIIVWGLSVLLLAWMATSAMRDVTRGAFSLAGNVAGGAVAGATTGASQLAAGAATNPNAAQRAANRIDSTAQANKAQVESTTATVREQAGEVALGAQHTLTGAAWAAFIMLVLTAGAAAWGGSAAARRHVASVATR
ncbi:MAG TPA: hypothetical protein VF722_12160 [Gemmatimonadaceae bacterium]|jgi:hypothetical protein